LASESEGIASPEAEKEEKMNGKSRTKRLLAAGALVVGGFGVGAAVAATGTASAAGNAVSSSVSGTAGQVAQHFDPSRPMRSDEHLLTGTTLAKVTAAAKAKYPNATIQRVETDSDGVYEAHIVTSGGQQLIVQVGSDYGVTGTQTFGGPGGPPPSGSLGG
jgi:hypothetical protein